MQNNIQDHFAKQRTRSDFRNYFRYYAPNRHLPEELKHAEEVTPFVAFSSRMGELQLQKKQMLQSNDLATTTKNTPTPTGMQLLDSTMF